MIVKIRSRVLLVASVKWKTSEGEMELEALPSHFFMWSASQLIPCSIPSPANAFVALKRAKHNKSERAQNVATIPSKHINTHIICHSRSLIWSSSSLSAHSICVSAAGKSILLAMKSSGHLLFANAVRHERKHKMCQKQPCRYGDRYQEAVTHLGAAAFPSTRSARLENESRRRRRSRKPDLAPTRSIAPTGSGTDNVRTCQCM